MTALRSEARIVAPTEKVWEVLADIGGIYKWNPGVSKSHATSEHERGEGVTRHCDLQDGNNYLEERTFDWREGEGFKIDVYETSLPLKSNIVSFEVRPDGDGTLASVTIDYQFKYGPIGALMDLAFARRQAQRGFDEMMIRLKHHVETGELVGEKIATAAS